MFLKHKYESRMQCSGPSPRTALLRLQEGDNAVGAPHQTHLSHPHFLLFFRTFIFSLDPIFKFLQALPLGCDCAFHSGREHQDLLPPEGRIGSDTFSQKSQTSEIPYKSDVTDVKVNCDLLSHKGWQTESQWQGGQPSPRLVTSSTFFSFFNFHILRLGPLARFLTLCMVHCPA